jgi:hypothetical protein
MTPTGVTTTTGAESDTIRQALDDSGHAWPSPVVDMRRRRSAYASSWPLEEIDLRLADGSRVALVFKDLSPAAATCGADRIKPDFLCDPRREIDVYTGLLAQARAGTAVCYGTLCDEAAGRFWLFLERVPGVELYQVGDVSIWAVAARWLAGWHARFAGAVPSLDATRLIRYDERFYRRWPERALEHVDARPPAGASNASDVLAAIARGYDRVVDALLAAENTVLHGECYASNVRVDPRESPGRVCPVDWEMAAVGPGLVDLAALTSGRWTESERMAIVSAYYDALPPSHRGPSRTAFLETLDFCRVHVAMQWLGWARDWCPPAEHAHDWLGEAWRLARRLGISQ